VPKVIFRMLCLESYSLVPTVGDVKQSLGLVKYRAMRTYA